MSKKNKERNIVARPPAPDMSEINKLLEEVTAKAKKMQAERVATEFHLLREQHENRILLHIIEMLKKNIELLKNNNESQKNTIADLTGKNERLVKIACDKSDDYIKAEHRYMDCDSARTFWKCGFFAFIFSHLAVFAARLLWNYMKG